MTERSEIPIPSVSKIREAFAVVSQCQDSDWWKSAARGNSVLTNYYGGMTEPPRDLFDLEWWVGETTYKNVERFKSEPLRYGYLEYMPYVAIVIQQYTNAFSEWVRAENSGDDIGAVFALGKVQANEDAMERIDHFSQKDLRFVEKAFFKIPEVNREAYDRRLSTIYPRRKKRE